MISKAEGIELLKEYTDKQDTGTITTSELEHISLKRDTAVRDKVSYLRKLGKLHGPNEADIVFAIWLEATRILSGREQAKTGPLPQMARAF